METVKISLLWMRLVCFFMLVGAMTVLNAQQSFEFKDWELQCDNTRTCRAAGYAAKDASTPASLFIQRAAGADTPVAMMVQHLPDLPSIKGNKVTLSVGDKKVTDVILGRFMTHEQAKSVLSAILNAETLTIEENEMISEVSLAGVKAVLTKMDDFQGRVGSRSAIVAKGNAAVTVLPALPLPQVQAVKIVAPRPGDQQLIQQIKPTLRKNDCDPEAKLTLRRLSDQHVLMSYDRCYVGAYNSSNLYTVVEDKVPYRLVQSFDGESLDEFGDKTSALYGSYRGRGIGDCWGFDEWIWAGTRFVKTRQTWTGMCRGFPGGAWEMHRYVSRIIPAK